jgi:signal transduction histidine kinase/CheY-like chemotaxis protein
MTCLPSLAQNEEDQFWCYFEDVESDLWEASKEEFLGDLQIKSKAILDTLQKIEHKEKKCFLSRAYMYHAMGYFASDIEKAHQLIDHSIALAKQCDDRQPLIHSVNRKGIFLASYRHLDSALVYFKEAHDLCVKHNEYSIWGIILTNICRANLYLDDMDEFNKIFPVAKNYFLQYGDSNSIAFTYEIEATYHLMMKDYKNASVCYDNFYSWYDKEISAGYEMILSKMVDFYEKTKNYKKLSFYYKELLRVKSFERNKKFNERYDNLAKEFEVKESESKLKNLELQNQLVNEKADAQRKWIVFFVLIGVLLLLGILAIYRNYRLQKKFAFQMNEKNSELEKANKIAVEMAKSKTEFSANISHELRTPLHGIIGLTSLLNYQEKDSLSEDGKMYLENLEFSADYLLSLINDVLEISKIDSKTIHLEDKSFNVALFINNLSTTFTNLIERSNNQFDIIIDPKVPEYIKGDPIRLSQILINLIGNSLKFTRNGEVELRLKYLSENKEKVKLRFEIEDNGPGIPKEKQEDVFNKFIQIKNQSSNLHGTGLGLPIVKELLHLFGSEIVLKSELGKGSVFSFEIDFLLGDRNEISHLSDDKSLNKYGLENKSILLVDDNQINLIVSEKILELDGYSVITCKNGVEALNLLSKTDFDLVLMDLHMPKMDGEETVKEIRKTNNIIPIILITASSIANQWDYYKSLGFNDFIVKPYDKYNFLQKITKVLKNNNGSKN